MKLDDITVVGGPLVLSTTAEVDAAEAALGLRFPIGYREYVTRFGEGVLGGDYVRIYPPRRILGGSNNVQEWRRRVGAYWFWDAGRQVLTKAQALEGVIIGDTVDGDELLVHPSDPERIYVTGLRGPLEDGWQAKLDAFAKRLVEASDQSKL